MLLRKLPVNTSLSLATPSLSITRDSSWMELPSTLLTTVALQSHFNWVLGVLSRAGSKVSKTCVLERRESWLFHPVWATAPVVLVQFLPTPIFVCIIGWVLRSHHWVLWIFLHRWLITFNPAVRYPPTLMFNITESQTSLPSIDLSSSAILLWFRYQFSTIEHFQSSIIDHTPSTATFASITLFISS